MGYKKYFKKNMRKALKGKARKARLIKWRREPVTLRLDNPTRPDRAKALGYKAKQGVFVVRQRVKRGGRQRPQIKMGRRSAHYGRTKVLDKSYQTVAEQRVDEKHPNCEVLNSYYVAEDGEHYWYEVIVADPESERVKEDDDLRRATSRTGKAMRGLTSSGKKTRGLVRGSKN